MTGEQLIAEARQSTGMEIGSVLEACEAFYMDGCPDEQTGSVDEAYHVYRVDRWLVFTNDHGFKALREYESVADAKATFAGCAEEL